MLIFSVSINRVDARLECTNVITGNIVIYVIDTDIVVFVVIIIITIIIAVVITLAVTIRRVRTKANMRITLLTFGTQPSTF